MLLLVFLLRDAGEVAEATDDLYLLRLERRLHPEGASGPALAGEAVTDGDDERIAVDLEAELPAVTGGSSGGHRRGRYPTRVSASLRYWWTKAIAMLPSPTAAATRFTGPRRTSPHAKIPGTLVSRR